MKKPILKVLSFIQVASIAVGMMSFTPAAAATTTGQWLAGDFHTHTYLSDGSYTAAEVAANAKKYGLDWYSAADHGGNSKGTRDQNGNAWTVDQVNAATGTNGTSTIMPRWATIYGVGEDMINQNRGANPTLLQFTGFEWNVPTHEHASVGMVGTSADTKKNLAVFEYMFENEYFNNTSPLFSTLNAETTVTINGTTFRAILGRAMDGNFEALYNEVAGKWQTSISNTFKTDYTDSKYGTDAANITAKLSSKLSNNKHYGAIAGAKYLQDNFPTTSYFLINHPSRNLSYTAADLKEFNDAAPDVAFGAELLPGHQASDFRGGMGYMNIQDPVQSKNVNINSTFGSYALGDSTLYSTVESKVDGYLTYYKNLATSSSYTAFMKTQYTDNCTYKSSTDSTKVITDLRAYLVAQIKANIPQQRTYGGADYLLAKVGGAYDTMLSEGRKFWLFGNSDFHIDSEKAATIPGQEPDFWPGQYSKNYTFCADKSYQSILDGMRSGNSFAVLGDLVNALDYKISNNDSSATMGQTLTPIAGKATTVTIRFKSPATNANGQTPSVDHIDLIGGEVFGIPATKMQTPDDTHTISDFTDPKQYLTKEYQNNDVSATTKVIKTFNKSEFTVDKDGYYSLTFTLPATDKDMFYRLRGTNNAVGTINVDANGNPTIDTPIESVVGGNTTEKAFSDLWFYSNPVFVNKQVNGLTLTGTLTDANGNPMANTKVQLHSTVQTTTTDANGKYTFTNVELGLHTISVLDASGATVGELTFMLQSGAKTEFADGDVWVANGVTKLELDFKVSGSTVTISGIKELERAVSATNPKTGVPLTGAVVVFIMATACVFAVKYSKKNKDAKGSK